MTMTAGWICSSASLWSFPRRKAKTAAPARTRSDGYCIPHLYKPTSSWLFHNNGDGTFTDVSKASGIAGHRGKAWGVVATDINNDGNMDLFVANDTVANFLFVNKSGKFEEIGEQAGVAYSAEGRAALGDGRGFRGFRPGWLDGPVRGQHRPRDLFPLSKQ